MEHHKVYMLELICKDIMTHSHLFMTMKLVITGTDPVSVEINPACVIIYPRHENYARRGRHHAYSSGRICEAQKALVVADDTDVFVLLIQFCCKEYGIQLLL